MLKRIKDEQLQARKNKDKVKGTILTTLYGECAIVGKNDGSRETTDEECLKVITKFLKNAKEIQSRLLTNSLIEGGSDETTCRIINIKDEINLYESFLPKQLTEEELTEHIKETIALGANNMGAVMKCLKQELPGLYDGKLASKITKELL
jgi:hypothetical protein